jgi:hypothetical protein
MHTKEPRTHAAEKVVFKVNIATGHDSYEAWREGAHDDLVFVFRWRVGMRSHVGKEERSQHTFLR